MNIQLRESSQTTDLTNNTVNPIPRVLQPNIPYQRNTTTLPPPDAVNNEAAYEDIVIQRIHDTIMDRVGQPSAYNIDEVKHIKPPVHKPYNSEDNIEVFETWLADMLRWFWIIGMTGASKDQM